MIEKLLILGAIVANYGEKGPVNPYTNVATLEIHAYTSALNPTQSHAYIVVKNLTSSGLLVGYKTVPAHGTVTLGKWSSGLSSFSSSVTLEYSGVYYNLEKYAFCHGGTHSNDIYLSATLIDDVMPTLNYVIQSENNGYSLLDDNCVTFALDVWNSVATPSLAAAYNTPASLRNVISMYANDYIHYQNGYDFGYNSYFYRYNTSTNSWITYGD